MRREAFLYIDERATWLLSPGSPPSRHAHTAEGRQTFAARLGQIRPTAVRLLVHLAEEEIVPLLLPPLAARDQANFAQRRLTQQFADHTLRCASHLSASDNGQPCWRLAALPDTPLTPWLDLLEAATCPLAGIWSLSQFAHLLQEQLTPLARTVLLLVVHDRKLTEYILRSGHIIFARHASAALLAEPEELAVEIDRLERYLAGQHWLAPGQPLPVHLLWSPEQARPEHLPDGLRHHVLPLAEDWVNHCLAALRQHPPAEQFAPPAWRAAYRARYRAIAGQAAAWLTGSALLVLAIVFLRLTLSLPAVPPLAEVAPIPAAPALPAGLDAAQVHRLAEAYRAARRSEFQSPAKYWRPLGAALEALPAITLNEINGQADGADLHCRAESPDASPTLQSRLRAAGLQLEALPPVRQEVPPLRIAGQSRTTPAQEFTLRLRLLSPPR